MRALVLLACLVGCDSGPECRDSGTYAVSYVGSQQTGACMLASQTAASRALEDTTVLTVTVASCLSASASRSYVDAQGCTISLTATFDGHPDFGDWTSGGDYAVTATCGTDSCTLDGSVFPMFDSR